MRYLRWVYTLGSNSKMVSVRALYRIIGGYNVSCSSAQRRTSIVFTTNQLCNEEKEKADLGVCLVNVGFMTYTHTAKVVKKTFYSSLSSR